MKDECVRAHTAALFIFASTIAAVSAPIVFFVTAKATAPITPAVAVIVAIVSAVASPFLALAISRRPAQSQNVVVEIARPATILALCFSTAYNEQSSEKESCAGHQAPETGSDRMSY